MGQSRSTLISTSELMDLRTNSLCTLVSYSNLVQVVITWRITMHDLSLPMTKIMMPGAKIVLFITLKAKEVDGGLVYGVIVR